MISLVLGWIIAGLIVGAVARLLVPGKQPMGCLAMIGLGLAGSVVGGLIAWLIWGTPSEEFSPTHWPGYLMAIVGSVIVLLVVRMLRRPQ